MTDLCFGCHHTMDTCNCEPSPSVAEWQKAVGERERAALIVESHIADPGPARGRNGVRAMLRAIALEIRGAS